MPKSILCVRDIESEGVWRILREAADAPQTHVRNDSLQGHTAALLFKNYSMEDDLSFGASINHLGGQTLRLLPGQWRTDSASLADDAPLLARSADICIAIGLDPAALEVLSAHCDVPVLNGGNRLGHPCAALADVGCLLGLLHETDTLRIAWVGGVNGLAHSLMEAAMYIPFELFMAVPPWSEPDHALLDLALRAGAKIFLTREPHMALDDAHFVYAGTRPEPAPGQPLHAGLPLTPEMLALARPGARVLRGALTLGAVNDIDSDSALQAARWDWRLRVQKTLLPLMLSGV